MIDPVKAKFILLEPSVNKYLIPF